MEDEDNLSYERLLELADNMTPESEEELKVLAEQFNVSIENGDTPRDIAMKVFQAAEKEADNETLS